MSMLRTDNLKTLSASPTVTPIFLLTPFQLSSPPLPPKNCSHVEKNVVWLAFTPSLTPKWRLCIYTYTHTHRPIHTQAHTHNSPPSQRPTSSFSFTEIITICYLLWESQKQNVRFNEHSSRWYLRLPLCPKGSNCLLSTIIFVVIYCIFCRRIQLSYRAGPLCLSSTAVQQCLRYRSWPVLSLAHFPFATLFPVVQSL